MRRAAFVPSGRIRAAIVALALLDLPGCDFFGLGGDEETALRILALDAVVVAGGTQGIRTENRTDRSIFFNSCPRFFERRIGGAWAELPETLPEACPEHLEELPAGVNSGFVTSVPSQLGPGTYRIVFEAFWVRQLDASQTQVIGFDLLPLAQRTTGSFEVGEVQPVELSRDPREPESR